MSRGLRMLVVAALVPASGCSLALDFSDDKIPKDAAIDAIYTQPECDFDEPNDTPAMAALVTSADIGPAAICPGDLDYYQFVVPAGTTSTSVKILFTNSATGDLDLKLFDSTGATQLGASLGFTDNEQIVCPGMSPFCAALTPGSTYIFEVFPAVAGDVNFYGIDLEFTPPST